MIDNFNIIGDNFLKFQDKDDFYFLQIIKRRKDNPELAKNEKLIDSFYIYSLEDYNKLREKIISICNQHNARAYFRLNKRNAKKIGLQALKKITDLVICEDYKAIKNIYPSVCGEFHQDNDKKWILDLDGECAKHKELFYEALNNTKNDPFNKSSRTNAYGNSYPLIIGEIPTKNGIHIVISPCDTHLLMKHLDVASNKLIVLINDIYKNNSNTWDLHKDSPTLLYMP